MPKLQDFEGYLGQPFFADQTDIEKMPFVLIEAKPLAQASSAGERTPFSLLFRNTASISQQTCRLVHPELGEMDVFLVPVAREGEVTVYEALFQ
ncbi:MAG: hypothetical protein M3Q42_06160 [Pseudomonadota bacterium]|nr:hypothetical protein [Pseudomonadota bacterium]